jgi:hypothetical protein
MQSHLLGVLEMNKKKQFSTKSVMRLLGKHALENVTGGGKEQKMPDVPPTPDGKDQ